MKIIVQAIPPSNNQFMGNSHNFNAYRKIKENWHWLIKAAIKIRPPTPYQKAVIKITYYFPDKRRRDPDNYSGKKITKPVVFELGIFFWKFSDSAAMPLYDVRDRAEIIGNIFENPELVEVEK